MKTRISIIIILLLNILVINGIAQPLTLKLWPDGIPGSKADGGYVEKITTVDGRITRCEKVTDPVIPFDTTITHMGSRNNLVGLKPSETQVRRFSNDLQITADTPPAFLVHSADDSAVPVMNSIGYFKGLQKMKIPAELHIFQKGGHGYGLSPNGGTESSWPDLCLKWLKATGLL